MILLYTLLKFFSLKKGWGKYLPKITFSKSDLRSHDLLPGWTP